MREGSAGSEATAQEIGNLELCSLEAVECKGIGLASARASDELLPGAKDLDPRRPVDPWAEWMKKDAICGS